MVTSFVWLARWLIGSNCDSVSTGDIATPSYFAGSNLRTKEVCWSTGAFGVGISTSNSTPIALAASRAPSSVRCQNSLVELPTKSMRDLGPMDGLTAWFIAYMHTASNTATIRMDRAIPKRIIDVTFSSKSCLCSWAATANGRTYKPAMGFRSIRQQQTLPRLPTVIRR